MPVHTSILGLALGAGVLACSDLQDQGPGRSVSGAPELALVDQTRVVVENTGFNACTGELIDFIGYFHYTAHETISANGRYHIDVHQNTQGVKGVGQTSGEVYHEVGASSVKGNAGSFEGTPPFEFSSIAHGALVGPGPDNNLDLKITSHFVVNANGMLTVAVDRVETECR